MLSGELAVLQAPEFDRRLILSLCSMMAAALPE